MRDTQQNKGLSRADRLCYDVVKYLDATRRITHTIEKHLPDADDALSKIESAIKHDRGIKCHIENMFAMFRMADMRAAVNSLRKVSSEDILRRRIAYIITSNAESANDD